MVVDYQYTIIKLEKTILFIAKQKVKKRNLLETANRHMGCGI